jgi:broad specificity phosphatase PhoE
MNKNDLPEKIVKWKDNIISKTKALSQDSVVFTHFMVINALLSELNSKTKLLYFYPDYTSIVKITIEDGEFINFSIDKDKKTFINL